MCVALGMRHAKRMCCMYCRHLRPVCLSVCLYSIFFTLSHKWHNFWKRVIDDKMCVLIFSLTFLRNISQSEKNLTRYHKFALVFMLSSSSSSSSSCCLSDFNENWISWQIIEKYSNVTLYENTYNGRRVVPWGRTDRQTDRPTDMTKLIVAFRNFANAPKNC
jgi:hypothetical protein